ncbi:DUF485 domain-containing protein [Oceanobacillus zhaokaii]
MDMAVNQEYDKARDNGNTVDFEKAANSNAFKKLLEDRKKFILPLTIFFLIFYFLLPILTSYTTFLNTPAIGDISWVWIFAISQFAMTWILCTIYVKKANTFDEQAEQIVEEIKRGGDSK